MHLFQQDLCFYEEVSSSKLFTKLMSVYMFACDAY